MPIYVYKNLNTGERFEVEQRITEPPLEEHPETGDPVKRLIQPVGIAFKGSGFYATDSRSSTRATQGPSASADSASTEGSGSGTASDASAAKPDSGKETAKPAAPATASSKKD